MFIHLICNILESYVKRYFNAHPNIKLVVVTGSVGKTSTKMAIATLLSERYSVRFHEGNHNAMISSPIAILGIKYPDNIRNPFAWFGVFRAAKKRINQSDNVDVIVQELGSDRIGEIIRYGRYLNPDICVITAVSPEHMEYFHSIDNVAREELEVANYSKIAMINGDDVDNCFLKYVKNTKLFRYGTGESLVYRFEKQSYSIQKGYSGNYIAPELSKPSILNIKVIGEHSLKPAIAAVAVALRLGLSIDDIKSGLSKIKAVSGRMNVLNGIKNILIIDDTYNSSPLAAESAIKTLCDLSSSVVTQRIAVLGDMNELGDTSDFEHKRIGKLCKPDKIDWVITVGSQSKAFIASEAKANGCNVKSFDDPISAGEFVRNVAKEKAVVLFKGSQGGIFLEEAVKMVLESQDDVQNLVRQSPSWMRQKEIFFSKPKS